MSANNVEDIPDPIMKACKTALTDIDNQNPQAERISEDKEEFVQSRLNGDHELEVNDSYRGNYAIEEDAAEYLDREISEERMIGDMMHKEDVGVDHYLYFLCLDPQDTYDELDGEPVILEYQLGIDYDEDRVHLNLSDTKDKWIGLYRKTG